MFVYYVYMCVYIYMYMYECLEAFFWNSFLNNGLNNNDTNLLCLLKCASHILLTDSGKPRSVPDQI